MSNKLQVPSVNKATQWAIAAAFSFATVMVGMYVWNGLKKKSDLVRKVDQKVAQGWG